MALSAPHVTKDPDGNELVMVRGQVYPILRLHEKYGIATDVVDLNAKNNAAKEELEKARVLLIKKLNENFLALNQANSSITGLLQSAVTVKEARSEAFQSLSKATEGKIDLDKVFSELDTFVLKGGEEAGKAIKLVAKLKVLLNENQGKEEAKNE